MTATGGRWMDVKEIQRLVMLQAKIDRLRIEVFEAAISVPGEVNAIEAAVQGALGSVRNVRQTALQQAAQPTQQPVSSFNVQTPGGGSGPGMQIICPIGSVPDGQGGCTTG